MSHKNISENLVKARTLSSQQIARSKRLALLTLDAQLVLEETKNYLKCVDSKRREYARNITV